MKIFLSITTVVFFLLSAFLFMNMQEVKKEKEKINTQLNEKNTELQEALSNNEQNQQDKENLRLHADQRFQDGQDSITVKNERIAQKVKESGLKSLTYIRIESSEIKWSTLNLINSGTELVEYMATLFPHSIEEFKYILKTPEIIQDYFYENQDIIRAGINLFGMEDVVEELVEEYYIALTNEEFRAAAKNAYEDKGDDAWGVWNDTKFQAKHGIKAEYEGIRSGNIYRAYLMIEINVPEKSRKALTNVLKDY